MGERRRGEGEKGGVEGKLGGNRGERGRRGKRGEEGGRWYKREGDKGEKCEVGREGGRTPKPQGASARASVPAEKKRGEESRLQRVEPH